MFRHSFTSPLILAARTCAQRQLQIINLIRAPDVPANGKLRHSNSSHWQQSHPFLSKPKADILQQNPGLTHPVDREAAETCRLTGSRAFPKTEPRVLSGQTQGKYFLLWPMSLSERRNSCDPDRTGNDCTRCEAIENHRPERCKTNPAIKNLDRRGFSELSFQHFPFLLPTRLSPPGSI